MGGSLKAKSRTLSKESGFTIVNRSLLPSEPQGVASTSQ